MTWASLLIAHYYNWFVLFQTIREAIASSVELGEQSAEEMAFPSSSSLSTSNEPLPQSETDNNYLTETVISKEVNVSNEEAMEEDLVCLNCHTLEQEVKEQDCYSWRAGQQAEKRESKVQKAR